MNDDILHFHGTYRFFSNFYPSPLTYGGLQFRTVEHAYQAAKTEDLELREGISEIYSPATAKRMGRMFETAGLARKDWHAIKVGVMRELLVKKFAPASTFGNMLLETGDVYLVEGNHWHDNFWGRCNCTDCSEARREGPDGFNWLGRLLVEQRANLQRV